MRITESGIQRAILDFLAYKQVFHFRLNSGAFRTQAGGFYHMGTPGAPDILCCINGRFVGIEVKVPNGKLSATQESFKQRLEEAGGRYVVARSVDDVMIALATFYTPEDLL